MKMLISMRNFNNLKAKALVPILCKNCSKTFYLEKSQVLAAIKNINIKTKRTTHGRTAEFCSRSCYGKFNNKGFVTTCGQCKIKIIKKAKELRKSKSKRFFCCQSCAATYNNMHKTKGTRCSKLEKWLQQKLPEKYKSLNFCFNQKDAIESELDIYIPSLKLAFELNGIYHYEPIHGIDKLQKVQFNDNRKFQECLKRDIELCIIDSSGLLYFKEQNAQKYLDIVCSIINQNISRIKL